ncbi:MAG: PqqD family peptide modification chaperone [Proteobacteria bacterium]|nr:MAG: PqqD family peptide modification chaperone [Pseudomonadota bacterium]
MDPTHPRLVAPAALGMVWPVSSPLYSPQWHEIAALRPALRSTVQARRLRSRGCSWQMLSSPESRQQLRLNTAAWRFVGLLDGKQTVDALWQRLIARFGDEAPSQPEVLDLLAQLSGAGFLRADVTPDLPAQFDQARRQHRKQRLAALSPLAVRVRLYDPAALLERLHPLGRYIFSLPALCVWLALVGFTALQAGSDWARLTTAIGQALHSPRFVVIAWIVYPLMKAAHELAHGIAVRRWGGTVHTAGFTLLVLVPVPYLDASAANGFGRAQRAIVSAAGIQCELLIAALAFWVWSAVAPGLVQDIALTACFIGAASSLLVNGNPLLRFDGYYAFSDALDLPNLASRSRRWWQQAIGRYVFRLQRPAMVLAPGEARWLMGYAPAAWLFQLVIGIQIARWLAGWSAALGVLAAVFLLITLLCLPLWRAIQAWAGGPPGPSQRRARRRLGVAFALIIAGLTLLPVPSATRVPGVLALPDAARLHTDTAGFVAEVLARDGDTVVAGQAVVRLDDPALAAAEHTLLSQLVALQARRYGQLLSNPREAGDVIAQIATLEQDLADIRHRIAALALRAGVDGRVALAHQDDLPGTYLPQGHTLGHVVPAPGMTVRAVVSHEQIAHIRASTAAVSVLPASAAVPAIPARATRFAEGATHTLPSPALSDRFGGPIPAQADDPDGLRAATAVFEIELALDTPPRHSHPGERVWVRFAHPDAPLATQWARRGRQLLLQFINEAG